MLDDAAEKPWYDDLGSFLDSGLIKSYLSKTTLLKTHFLFGRSEFLSEVPRSVIFRKPT